MVAAAFGGLLVSKVHAHEHHEDNIPEGEGVSPDPIVYTPNTRLE